MRILVFGILATIVVSSFVVAPLLARDPVSVSPSSQWNVDFGETTCRLSRTFGEGDNLHLLFFEQHYPSTTAGMTVAGPSLDRFRSRRPTYLSFSDQQERRRTEPLVGNVDHVGSAVIYSSVDLTFEDNGESEDELGPQSLPQLDTEFGTAVQFVSVKQGGREIRLATGPLGEAFGVLNTCTQDMVRDWGLDVEKHLTATRQPNWLNTGAIVRRIQNKYPGSALTSGEQAIVRMRVIVDEEGRVESCRIDKATDNELESPACKEMERARFEPALDAQGQPFRSFYATSITYVLGR